MSDIFSTEYTELRNAPHFIYNGYHTRDFNVSNVQVDSGLAKETFLPDRTPTIEKTRFSEKSYLLGYTEEPLKFKVRLLFDEHRFTLPNIMALRRMIDTTGFKEFKFDNEEESSLNIVVYAMITGTSEMSHNVINDGYVDLEFQTNSPRRYSELMIDEYDFSIPASTKMLEEFTSELNTVYSLEETFGRSLKQYTARTNYANIEELFIDKNKDMLPDGWKLISGKPENIHIDSNTRNMKLNNIHLRKRIHPINNRYYYIRMHGSGGKFRIHENNFDISDGFVHMYKYRRNLLNNSGTFDLDSSGDGIGEGWISSNPNFGNYTIDRDNEIQTISSNGILKTDLNIAKMQKYIVIAETPNGNSKIKIGNNTFFNESDTLHKHKFIGSTSDNNIQISAMKDSTDVKYSHIRVFAITDDEYKNFDNLSNDEIRKEYPHTDAHDYFDIDYTNESGYINYIDMWELNDIHKKQLDEGMTIEHVVNFDYKNYKTFLDRNKERFTKAKSNLLDNFTKLESDKKINFATIRNKTLILLQKMELKFKALDLGDDMRNYQWADLQPHFKDIMKISSETKSILPEIQEFIKLNSIYIDNITAIADNKITVYNFGDKPVYPTFYFESTNGSNIQIRNKDTGESSLIEDNIKGETITMIGSTEQIYTSRPSPYFKYDSHDDNFIRLGIGHNDLEFSGSFKLKIQYQFVLL
ncbi:hypothetical protein [Staphylococcus gallinarum]|uniref:hypothetical protein n=1 Tax=Staphylococcus gallinarum TaxID=1293 RepID=UPI0030C640C9